MDWISPPEILWALAQAALGFVLGYWAKELRVKRGEGKSNADNDPIN